MSLFNKIMNLISGFTDPSIRIEIARTIRYLFEVWLSRRAPEEEIANSLLEVCTTIVELREPYLSPDEIREKAEECAKEIYKAFKTEAGGLVIRKRLRAI